MLLAEDDYHIVGCSNGREALEHLRENTPSLILLALDLPDIGGDEVCEKVKSVRRLASVPVVLVAAQPDTPGIEPAVRRRARAAGADLLLQKPLSDKNLRDRIRHLMAGVDVEPRSAAAPTKTTAVIEEALAALGEPLPAEDASAVAASLARENDELRFEIAALKRKLTRLESALRSHGGEDARATAADVVRGGATAEPRGRRSDAGAPAKGPATAEGASGHEPANGDTDKDDRIRDLERRNRALKEALVKERDKDAPQRGLFGRRRDT